MKSKSIAVFLLGMILAGLSLAQAAEPPAGSPLRAMVLDTLRPRVERDLGQPVKFVISTLNVDGGWAYVSATPVRAADGAAIDWRRTRFAREIANGVMSDMVDALLRDEGGRWGIVEYALGPSDVVWVEWIKKYRLPEAFFLGTGGAGSAAINPSPNPPMATAPSSPTRPPTQSPTADRAPLAPKPAAPAPEERKREAAFDAYMVALRTLEAFEASHDMDQWQEGLEAAEWATRLDSEQADYWRALGYAYALVAGEDHLASTMAENAFSKAISRDGRDTAARLSLAQLQLARASFSLALDNLEAALKLKPELAVSPVVADMCRAYIADRQAVRGARYFAKFLDARPKAQSVRLGLAILLNETGRAKETFPLLRIVAEDPLASQQDAAQASEFEKAWQEAGR